MEISWFNENPDNFIFRLCTIGGDDCVLIRPKPCMVSAEWTDSNKIYRSSIWRLKDGFPVSLGYKKFMNHDERPETFEEVNSEEYKNITKENIRDKLDGTCIIISKYNDELIVRTRGTVHASVQPNYSELEKLINKYDIKNKFNGTIQNKPVSLIFEWLSPSNPIIIFYEKENLILTGAVFHEDYSYMSQKDLDSLAKLNGWERPHIIFDEDMWLLHKDVNTNIDKNFNYWSMLATTSTKREGYVVYFNNGQILKKLKTNWYKVSHTSRFSSDPCKYLLEDLIHFGDLDSVKIYSDKTIIDAARQYRDHEVVETLKDQILEINRIYKEHILKPLMMASYYLEKEEAKDYKDVNALISRHPEVDKIFFWTSFKKKKIPPLKIKSIILKEFKKFHLQVKKLQYNSNKISK